MSADNQSGVIWDKGDVPVSARFDDPYFNMNDGLAETRHVFLAGNDLPGRFQGGFHVAELGFGTGLNFLATAMAWTEACIPGRLHYTSFEAFPLRSDEMARALAAFPELALLAADLIAARQDGGWSHSFAHKIDLTIIPGDARDTLPVWIERADAWFLDGFSPAKNPELWSEGLMIEVGRHTAPGGSFATYTAAGHVRRALQAAGFVVERCPGYGRKRHMSRGRMA